VFDNPIVFTSGALGGEGTFLQPVTVPNGGILTPGNSPGTLHGVDLTLENGALYEWEGTTTGSDLMDLTGSLFIVNDSLTTIHTTDYGTTPSSMTLFQFNSLIGANPGEDLNWTITGDLAGYRARVAEDGRSIYLLPEPATWTLMGAGALLLLRRRRTR
ncbi:MAG: PEP-CTERM sorting domain-containing protein, partial [Verrucomicrobia bacterium]|nr:PEP-CTERM sorting domain-containing protein [Verrucomicrobiota bacterium]